MIHMFMSVMVLMTLAAIALLGINYLSAERFVEAIDTERSVAAHLRLSMALQAYRTDLGRLPDEEDWLEALGPWLREDVHMPRDGGRWVYRHAGREFGVCLSGPLMSGAPPVLDPLRCARLPAGVIAGFPDLLEVAADGLAISVEAPADGSALVLPEILIANSGPDLLTSGVPVLREGQAFEILHEDCSGVLPAGGVCAVRVGLRAGGSGLQADHVDIMLD